MGCCCSSGSEKKKLNDSHLNHNRGQPNWDEVNPEIGFVIKTRRDDHSKVFVNLFYHNMLKRMIPIPLSQSTDKTGSICEVYGVAVPLQIFTKSAKNGTFRDKMCVDAIVLINATYSERLNNSYTVPKIVKGYMGNAVPKHVKVTPEDLIVKRKDRSVAGSAKDGDGDDMSVGTLSLMGGATVATSAEDSRACLIPPGATKSTADPTTTTTAIIPVPAAPLPTIQETVPSPRAPPVIVEAVSPHTSDRAPSITSNGTGTKKSRQSADANVVPVLKAWAQKKGGGGIAVALQLGSKPPYYFVLDAGTLSYYVDSREYSPYGTDLKGSHFLAGCKISNQSFQSSDNSILIEDAQGNKEIQIQYMDRITADRWLLVLQQHIDYANKHPDENMTIQRNNKLKKSSSRQSTGSGNGSNTNSNNNINDLDSTKSSTKKKKFLIF